MYVYIQYICIPFQFELCNIGVIRKNMTMLIVKTEPFCSFEMHDMYYRHFSPM